MRKKLKQNCNFFSEICFHRSVSWTPNNAILTNLLQWFRRKTKFYRLKAERDRKNVSLSRETMFCEKFLWIRKRQFWRPFRYNCCCSPIFSVQSARNEQKCTHFSKKIFHLNVSWTKEMQVWKPSRNNFAQLKFTSAQKPEVTKSPVDFQHFDFCPKYCLEKKAGFIKKCCSTVFFAEKANLIAKFLIL